MISKSTVLPVQTSMCESVRLRSLNDMCHDVMQRRNATLTDRKVGNSVYIRTYKCISRWLSSSFVLAPPTLHCCNIVVEFADQSLCAFSVERRTQSFLLVRFLLHDPAFVLSLRNVVSLCHQMFSECTGLFFLRISIAFATSE